MSDRLVGAEVKIVNPTIIASEEIIWLKKNGDELLIHVDVGMPYQHEGAWACPAALIGVDGRYPDIAGDSFIQALQLAIRLIRQRLGHLLDAGERLVYPADRSCNWDFDSLDAVFGLA